MADALLLQPMASNIMTMPPPPVNTTISHNLHPFSDDTSRWSAVQTRNALADGHFLYAVRSTKIYCRPICKARLARRANVSFFIYASEARNAGFRACKRCKPDEVGCMPEEKAVRRIREFVRDEGGEVHEGVASLGQMARRTGLSKWHFHRVFKRTVGVTPVEFARMRKRGQLVDPHLSHGVGRTDGTSGATTSASDSPTKGSDDGLNWLQEMDGEDFDFGSMEDLLANEDGMGDMTAQRSLLDGELTNGLSWTDFLTWPENSPSPTT